MQNLKAPLRELSIGISARECRIILIISRRAYHKVAVFTISVPHAVSLFAIITAESRNIQDSNGEQTPLVALTEMRPSP